MANYTLVYENVLNSNIDKDVYRAKVHDAYKEIWGRDIDLQDTELLIAFDQYVGEPIDRLLIKVSSITDDKKESVKELLSILMALSVTYSSVNKIICEFNENYDESVTLIITIAKTIKKDISLDHVINYIFYNIEM